MSTRLYGSFWIEIIEGISVDEGIVVFDICFSDDKYLRVLWRDDELAGIL